MYLAYIKGIISRGYIVHEFILGIKVGSGFVIIVMIADGVEYLQAHCIHEVDEEKSVRFFSALTDTLGNVGYEHYEISNFCKPGMHSRHNTSYWKGILRSVGTFLQHENKGMERIFLDNLHQVHRRRAPLL